jgi:hypothetical protein
MPIQPPEEESIERIPADFRRNSGFFLVLAPIRQRSVDRRSRERYYLNVYIDGMGANSVCSRLLSRLGLDFRFSL